MSDRPALDRWKAAWNEAVALDNAGHYAKALKSYQKAKDCFFQVCLGSKNAEVRSKLNEQYTQLTKRINELTRGIEQCRLRLGRGSSRPTQSPQLSTQDTPTTEPYTSTFETSRGDRAPAGNSSPLMGGTSPAQGTDSRIDFRKQNLSSLFDKSKSEVQLADVIGLDEAKQAVRESIQFPIKFSKLRQQWTCVLLYGPPGTGKTLLAQAVANEFAVKFLAVSPADLMSQWQGESEKYVMALFELAQDNSPCIIFIDEIDSVCSTRADREHDSIRRVKTQFLLQMNKLEKSDKLVLVLGATNIPWDLDTASLRRFQKRIYVGLPDLASRRALFELQLKRERHLLGSGDFEQLAERSEGLSASDITNICKEAKMEPFRAAFNARHFKEIVGSDGKRKFYPIANPSIRCRWPGCDCKDATLKEDSAIPFAFKHVEESELELPPVQWADVFNALTKSKRAVSDEDIARFEKWEKSTRFQS